MINEAHLEFHHKFVTLQIVMKHVVIKIFSVLLCMWYTISIIGFDVHTCKGSGHSFVVTFVEGLSCGDIHPEHVCGPQSCCSHHREGGSHGHGAGISSSSCCSDNYQVLALAGVAGQDSGRQNSDHVLLSGILLPASVSPDVCPVSGVSAASRLLHSCRHVHLRPCHSLYAVWRI